MNRSKHSRLTPAFSVLLTVLMVFSLSPWAQAAENTPSSSTAAESDSEVSSEATQVDESSEATAPVAAQSDESEDAITPQAGTLANVFLKSSGSDTADGTTPANAVKTFAEAKALLAEGGTIWICGEVNVTDNQAWDLDGFGAGGTGAGSIKRWVTGNAGGLTDASYMGRLISVTGSGDLTITNCDLNGMKSAGESGNMLYASGSSASLTLSTGAVAEDGYSVQGGCMYLTSGATATVNGDAVIRNCQSSDASAIADVGSGSKLTIGGTASVTGNSGNYAPIFLRGSGNTLTIQDTPTISDNTGTDAGLVQTHGSNTVNISGGTISGNSGQGSGAFLLREGDKLNMTGGTISGNSATNGGGGAITMNSSATATITGGSITGNSSTGSGAGIYVSSTAGTVNVGGTASITGNVNASTKGNICLQPNDTIGIVSALQTGASIGVLASGTAYGFDKDFAIGSNYTVQTTDAQYFSDDKANYGPIFDSTNNAVKWSGSLQNVFLRSSGSDSSDGTTPNTAVATFAQAKKLLKPGGTIWICGVVNVSGSESWDLSGYGANSTGPGSIKRWVKGQVAGITDGTYAYNLVVADGAANSVTMTNLTLDGQYAGISAGAGNADAGSNIWAKNKGSVTLGAGCIVEHGVSYHGGGVSLTDGGKLIMTDDAMIKDCKAGDAGGAVDMSGVSSLTMSGTSSITGCTSPFGVIFLRSANGTNNTVSLSDSASINGNTTTRSDQGTIDGHGGNTINIAGNASISENTAGRGGAISLERNDVLNMTGGTVTGNTASVIGAGVNVNAASATVNLSGAATIKGNTDSTAKGDLTIPASYKVNVTGALTGGNASIGIRVATTDHKGLHEFAKGSNYTTADSDASAFFDNYSPALPVELTPGSTVTPADGTDNTIRFAGYKVAYDTYGNVSSTEDKPVPETIATKTGLTYTSANLLPTATLTRNGYIFSGWYTTSDDTGTQVASTTKYSDIQTDSSVMTTTIHAHWTEKQLYSVVYDSNGGSPVAGLTNLKWTATGLIPTGTNVPTRPGYTLTGWKFAPSGDNVNVTSTTTYRSLAKVDTTTTITLVAQWTENPAVEIDYVSNNTTAGTVTSASESVKPVTGSPAGSAAVAKAGYNFDGWYDSTGTLLSTDTYYIPSRDDDGIYEAATYTARFSPSTNTDYTVRYYEQDVTGAGYTEVTADAVTAQGTTDTDPTFTQNSYAGFAYDHTTYETSTAAEGATAQTIAGDGSLVVRLYYTRNAHNVTFDAQGHGVTPTGYTGVRQGATIAEPAALTETGYTFGGWYTDAACTTAWDFSTGTMPDSDLTLYAKWTVNTYTVKFQAGQGGTLGGTISDQDVAYGGNANGVCTQNPISTDYDFLGWEYNYTGADGQVHSGVVADYTTVPIYGDVTFTSTYAKKPYVSITATNGLDNIVLGTTPSTSAPDAVTSKVDSSLTPVTLPAQVTMKYAPRDDNYSSTPQSIKVTDLAGNHATLVNGTNTFTPAGATSPVTIVVNYTDKTITATNINDSLKFDVVFAPVQTIYKVEHYKQNVDGTYPADATDTDTYSYVDAGSAAAYTPKTYTGASYDPTKTTWEATGAAASSTVLNVQPNGSLIIKLYYPLNTYTVTYDANGHGSATAPSPQTNVRYGSTIVAPTAPTESGWTFDGWYTDSACTAGNEWTFGDGGSTVTGDTTLYAKWSAKTYTVYYDTQGGTTVEPNYGVTWTQSSLTATTSRPGYTLAGWNTKADGTGDNVLATTTYSTLAGNDDTQVSETIYAIWSERSDFTLHYDSNGGTDVTDRSGVSWTQTGLIPTPPTKTGYTLDGWYTGTGDKLVSTTPFSATDPTGASDATVTAHWTANAYKIAFDKNGTDATGTMADEDMTYDVLANLTANAYTRPGYDFTGWKDDSGAPYTDGQQVENLTATDGETVTMHAQWDAHTYTVHFNATNGSGTMDDEDMTYGVAKNLTANVFTAPTGYHFAGWATTDGGAVKYADAASVINLTTEDGGTVDLYAVWVEDSDVTISYVSADATMGTVAPGSESIAPATGVASGSNATAAAGYHFVSWTDETQTVVSTNAQFTPAKVGGLNVAATYTANFAPNVYNIHFDGNGSTSGSMTDENMIYDVAAALTTNAFSRDGYTFAGWNTAADGNGTAYIDAQQVVNLISTNDGTVTLYAQWTSNTPAPSSSSTNGSAANTLPKTGDNGLGILATFALVALGMGTIVISRKRRRN